MANAFRHEPRFLNGLAAIAIMVCTGAHATSSVSFEADGYLLDCVVGGASAPAISSLSFAGPHSKQGASLPMRLVKVQIFDPAQRVLLLRFDNPGDSRLPESFSLTVNNQVGTLTIGKRVFVGSFAWGH